MYYYFYLVPIIMSILGLVALVPIVGIYVFTGMSVLDSLDAITHRGAKLTCWHCNKETLADQITCQHCGKELQ